jgi:hypothetical protein
MDNELKIADAVEEESDEMFIKVSDLENFMQQISFTLVSVVNGINQTMKELKRSTPSDDNKD